jgi:hypothetical protein
MRRPSHFLIGLLPLAMLLHLTDALAYGIVFAMVAAVVYLRS